MRFVKTFFLGCMSNDTCELDRKVNTYAEHNNLKIISASYFQSVNKLSNFIYHYMTVVFEDDSSKIEK